ncbi:MAG: flagellin lysine-N-methylase [Clostridia bacterium]|nr:flagellin lysine-N-methylase [Clostridia bacterium]
MAVVYPDYYGEFRCIADKCRHNCCIGWEIDIDGDTLDFYRSVKGDFGKRLLENISEDAPHFILGDNERCPFLNHKNLCDIITELGEGKLCSICRDHPRFRVELPGRTEVGLGLCCEEAARIVITKKNKTSLTCAPETDDEIILLRDEITALLQNREKSLENRLCDVFSLFGESIPVFSADEWRERLLALERLDDGWGERIADLRGEDGLEEFERYIAGRETEYEQFLVYIIYRHLAAAPDWDEAYRRVCFAAFCYFLIYNLGALHYKKHGKFTTADQIELVREFSAEIEYSDENLYAVIDSF